MEPSTNLINLKFDTEVTCGVSGEQEKITSESKSVREHSEDDDSDFIKRLKATGLVSTNDFQWIDGYIVQPGQCMIVDTHKFRDMMYKLLYIKRRDQQTRDKLIDKQFIRFIIGEECKDEERDEEREKCDNEYMMYEDFIKNGMKIENLARADDLMLACSKCDICFDYPCKDSVIYTIRANDEIVGFTRKELALKVMQLYCMMAFNYKNYDKTTAQITNMESMPKNAPQRIFSPINDEEWEENGMGGIRYNKEKDYWVCQCLHYI